MTYKDIKHNEEVNELLKKGNQNLGLLGYTDHSQAHCVRVAETAAHILKKFGYPEHDIELARIAGYLHDIGNAVNRSRHAEYGGLLANEILKQYDLSIPDRITIVSAISNHDESTGVPRFYKEILTQASPKFPASLKTKTRISGWVLMVRAYTKSIYQLNMSPITNLPATKTMTGASTDFQTIGSATYWKIERE